MWGVGFVVSLRIWHTVIALASLKEARPKFFHSFRLLAQYSFCLNLIQMSLHCFQPLQPEFVESFLQRTITFSTIILVQKQLALHGSHLSRGLVSFPTHRNVSIVGRIHQTTLTFLHTQLLNSNFVSNFVFRKSNPKSPNLQKWLFLLRYRGGRAFRFLSAFCFVFSLLQD